jgi:hypothetical protein
MICNKCSEEKVLVKGKWCKDCKNKYERERRSKIRLDINKKERERYKKKKDTLTLKELNIDLTQKKMCSLCKEEKTINLFYLAKCKGTVRSECKLCSSKLRKEYYKKNRKKIIKQTNAYKVNKYNTDPEFKLKRLLRCRLYHALRSQNAKKSNRTLKLTGCSLSFLVGYLEAKFKDKMTWENYGEWHVDHIIPVSSFNLLDEEEQKKCFNYTNLQPLWAEENLSKGNAILSEEELKKLNCNVNSTVKQLEKLTISNPKKTKTLIKEKRKCKKTHNQDLPKYIYYRESHGGKYKGYVVEHPKGTKRFGKKIFSLEENLEKAKEYLHLLN